MDLWHKVAEELAASLLPVRSDGVGRRPVVEAGSGHLAGRAAHLALVAARPVELDRCAKPLDPLSSGDRGGCRVDVHGCPVRAREPQLEGFADRNPRSAAPLSATAWFRIRSRGRQYQRRCLCLARGLIEAMTGRIWPRFPRTTRSSLRPRTLRLHIGHSTIVPNSTSQFVVRAADAGMQLHCGDQLTTALRRCIGNRTRKPACGHTPPRSLGWTDSPGKELCHGAATSVSGYAAWSGSRLCSSGRPLLRTTKQAPRLRKKVLAECSPQRLAPDRPRAASQG